MRGFTSGVIAAVLAVAGCAAEPGGPVEDGVGEASSELHWLAEWRQRQESNARGEAIWFDETFGGEKFFAWS